MLNAHSLCKVDRPRLPRWPPVGASESGGLVANGGSTLRRCVLFVVNKSQTPTWYVKVLERKAAEGCGLSRTLSSTGGWTSVAGSSAPRGTLLMRLAAMTSAALGWAPCHRLFQSGRRKARLIAFVQSNLFLHKGSCSFRLPRLQAQTYQLGSSSSEREAACTTAGSWHGCSPERRRGQLNMH